jgi:exodeoxyribonuclease VII large subunit
VITSPSGAVVHDILKIINRRFANIHIQIIPVKVQGAGAVEEIVSALELLNSKADSDVAILARGGGSLEDLQAFNSELVARAIFTSEIPIISAVGHETDYTIADFTADLRAPTPSAAAELAVPQKTELERRCRETLNAMRSNFNNYFKYIKSKLNEVSRRLSDPRRKIEDFRLKTDDLATRLNRSFVLRIRRERDHLGFRVDRLEANSPKYLLEKLNIKLEQNYNNLLKSYNIYNSSKQIKIRELAAKLEALNPIAILERGYSITRTIPEGALVKDSRAVALNQDLEVMVAKGRLICRVKGKSTDGEKNF